MLLNLTDLIRKHNLKITGVIHVGAHYGEENSDYLVNGITNRHYFEPMQDAYDELKSNVGDATCYKVALGSDNMHVLMHKEKYNKGQSNSLLQPGTHLKHYPLITFDETEAIQVVPMDVFDIKDCNFLNMDVQGYELEVLKGSAKTLEHIDYIYTEVNTEDVYIGCGKLHEIDAFLSEFTRVELSMTNQGWGDALYIRKPGATVEPVPEEFRPHHPLQYPADNDLIFEEWYYRQPHPETERIYLPIFWTSYYCKYNYGKNAIAIAKLQNFINRLDRSKQYYTVLQYDDGILNDISQLDIQVFASAGNRIDYPLPLICKPHKFPSSPVRDILVSYIGTNNHPIRNQLMQYMNRTEWYISDRPHSLEQYCNIIARSQYILCPRGYGKTSFRIMEALQYGCVPIYISDEFVIPHNNFSYGITTQATDGIDTMLSKPAMHPSEAYEKYFTYESNLNIIHEQLQRIGMPDAY